MQNAGYGHNVSRYREFYGLSLGDIAQARSLFHLQLLNYPNVVGTALGLYLFRFSDPELGEELSAAQQKLPKEERRFDNSGVRPYSWPCVLVIVDRWLPEGARPEYMLPRQLWLPDGKVVPVCVVVSQLDSDPRTEAVDLKFPRHLIGPGCPLLSRVQGLTRVGTVAGLFSDGMKTYALTSQHVMAQEGNVARSYLGGRLKELGRCATSRLTRLPLPEVYPELGHSSAFLNLDIALVELTDTSGWSTVDPLIGPLGPPVTEGRGSLSLSQVGQRLIAHGAASGLLEGEVKGLLFRYKSVGGFEYTTDYLIGPRGEGTTLSTRTGDSGAMWYLLPEAPPARAGEAPAPPPLPRPFAIQWGGEILAGGGSGQSFALASSLATVCRILDLDYVPDLRASLFRYWGAVGHYGIAYEAIMRLPASSRLGKLMRRNLENITFPLSRVVANDMGGLTKQNFVPLADVPDYVWKHGKQKHTRGKEGPNHFADMDMPDGNGNTLITFCRERIELGEDPLELQLWRDYYAAVGDNNGGILPFRVWQIFDQMVASLKQGNALEFVCAAGILSHYVGDACQPLHISADHDGLFDEQETQLVYVQGKGKQKLQVARGAGVHAAYEDEMINGHADEIFAAIGTVDLQPLRKVGSGRDAGLAVLDLMLFTCATLAPRDIVTAYIEERDQRFPDLTAVAQGTVSGNRALADALWARLGGPTIALLAQGAETLAWLWKAAWKAGYDKSLDYELREFDGLDELSPLYSPTLSKDGHEFLQSCNLKDIHKQLQGL